MEQSNKYYKNNPTDVILWLDNGNDVKGEWVFTFDMETHFNMFADYPEKLSAEQKKIFDKENPYWADFFKDR